MGSVSSSPDAKCWVGSWACAPQLTEPANLPPEPGLAHNTLRQVVFPTLAGSELRLRFSNEFGDGPLTLDAVHLASSTSPASAGDSGIDPRTDRALRFDGRASVTIPAGEVRVSDVLAYPLSALEKLAITICFGRVPRAITGHPGSRTTSYLQRGPWATAERLESAASTEHWYTILGIDVIAASSAAVVTFGDSITDGRGSTTDGNDRWPDNLARRLQGDASTSRVAVLNQGVGGNAVLGAGLGPPAVERFDRDVLGAPGVRWLVVLAGVNDLCTSTTTDVAARLIDAYQQFIEKAHARGIRAYGVPILPIGGSHYDTGEHELGRQRVNHWIRSSAAFDAVIDLEAVVRDPSHPTRLLARYDSGDQLHLSVAGYQAMANAIDLTLFTP